MNNEEALQQRELIRQLSLELLRTWGFHSEQLNQLFAQQNTQGRSRQLEDLEDAVLEAYSELWEKLQSEKIQVICPKTVRYALIDALRRRGLDRKPFTTHELLTGIAKSQKPTTRQRYLRWAKYELQDELKTRFAALFDASDQSSLDSLMDYFLAEFVPRHYAQLSDSCANCSLLHQLCTAFLKSESHVRRASHYHAWITPVCPRLVFYEETRHKLESRAWMTFEEQPPYEALIALERLRYQDRLIRCQRPDDELTCFFVDLRNSAERRRLELCLIFAHLKREPRRSLANLKAYMVYVFSHFPAVGRGQSPQCMPLEQVTLDMIQGCEFTWDEVCRRFPGGPQPGDYTTKRRIERDVIALAQELGFVHTEKSTDRGASDASRSEAKRP